MRRTSLASPADARRPYALQTVIENSTTQFICQSNKLSELRNFIHPELLTVSALAQLRKDALIVDSREVELGVCAVLKGTERGDGAEEQYYRSASFFFFFPLR